MMATVASDAVIPTAGGIDLRMAGMVRNVAAAELLVACVRYHFAQRCFSTHLFVAMLVVMLGTRVNVQKLL